MKRIFFNLLFLIAVAITWSACDDTDTYDGGIASPYIFTFDLRKIYKEADVVLTKQNMAGASSIDGIVVSDHSSKNMLAGLLMVQNAREASSGDSLRGIAINVGAAADAYKVGDRVQVKVEGRTLTRRDGMLQIVDVPGSDVVKISSGNVIAPNRVTAAALVADPQRFESTQVTIIKATFNPSLSPNDVFAGDKTLNDGFGDVTLHTEATATFANATPPFSANYTGVVVNSVNANGKLVPQIRLRNNTTDIKPLASSGEQQAIIISGFVSDPQGTDGNYEYIQFRATRAINFTTEPFSVVTTNNAGSTNEFPTAGWAMGGQPNNGARTYKFNLTSGSVAKGEFFYVGGTGKSINGSGSTSMASSKWIRSYDYVNLGGEGFGTKTGNLLANSGNPSGIAVFKGTTVTAASMPVDVVFIGTGNGGNVFKEGPPAVGYRVANNDVYDAVEPVSGVDQPFFKQGTNTFGFAYQSQGVFNLLGGAYNTVLGKWTKVRKQEILPMTPSTPLSEIENEFYRFIVDANGSPIRTDTIRPTQIK